MGVGDMKKRQKVHGWILAGLLAVLFVFVLMMGTAGAAMIEAGCLIVGSTDITEVTGQTVSGTSGWATLTYENEKPILELKSYTGGGIEYK
jgi:hypothetical protein